MERAALADEFSPVGEKLHAASLIRSHSDNFSEKTARNRHFVETLLRECDISEAQKLFN